MREPSKIKPDIISIEHEQAVNLGSTSRRITSVSRTNSDFASPPTAISLQPTMPRLTEHSRQARFRWACKELFEFKNPKEYRVMQAIRVLDSCIRYDLTHPGSNICKGVPEEFKQALRQMAKDYDHEEAEKLIQDLRNQLNNPTLETEDKK
jgi:hypothetical protein